MPDPVVPQMVQLVPSAPAVPGVKPGYKTTEFWLSFLAAIVSFAYGSGIVGTGTALDKGLGLIAGCLAAAGYASSRGATKAAATP